jgi:hypothetical protein
LVNGTSEEYKQEASTYIAYTGPFHVDEEKQTLTHTMFNSHFPNWTVQTQPRVVKIEGDLLHLNTARPIVSGGKMVNSFLTWKSLSRYTDRWNTRLPLRITNRNGRQHNSYTCLMPRKWKVTLSGKRPKCGIDLVPVKPAKKHEGHDGRYAPHHAADTAAW